MKQPHILPIAATISVTFRLHDAIPKQMIKRVQERRNKILLEIDYDALPDKFARKDQIERKYYEHLEQLTHQKRHQEYLLRNPKAAEIVRSRLEEYAGTYYELLAYSIMANHVHLLLDFSIQCPSEWDRVTTPENYVNLSEVIRKIKGGSAYDINKGLSRKGKVWVKGNYNRYIRDLRHLEHEFWYILRNPEHAGLVDNWREHPYTFGNFAAMGLEAA